MIRLVSFFLTVGLAAAGAALVAIQGVNALRDGAPNWVLLIAGACALAFGGWSIWSDKRRMRTRSAALKAAGAGTTASRAAERRYTEPAADRAAAARVSATSARSSSERLAPIDRILDAERVRTETFWREGLAGLAAEAEREGVGDGALVLLDAATTGMTKTMGARQVARLLHEVADQIDADRPPPRPAPAADAPAAAEKA
ncbi:hypothetical protein A33M_2464 [Rhodovulum sp. PH10]|uniref:hypothetical protein n=1 Tax=Rhodovulum sp. PH10 TaxID=1187851 RepID=UPI00027C2842|nr:hypothetical protein [Rhodovulum sp. PH10]EJW13604.1 hypothetical protein A33M_2464 [Rhodovulum sp. PH10]